jgi:hypothetical protein
MGSRENASAILAALPEQGRDWILRDAPTSALTERHQQIPCDFDHFLLERLARELKSDPFVSHDFVKMVTRRAIELPCPDVVSFQALCVNPGICEALFNTHRIDLGHVPIRWSYRVEPGSGSVAEAFRVASLICGRPVRRLWIEALEDVIKPRRRYITDFDDAFNVVKSVVQFLRGSVTESEWQRLQPVTERARRHADRLHAKVGQALTLIDALKVVDSPPAKAARRESLADLTNHMKRLCTVDKTPAAPEPTPEPSCGRWL